MGITDLTIRILVKLVIPVLFLLLLLCTFVILSVWGYVSLKEDQLYTEFVDNQEQFLGTQAFYISRSQSNLIQQQINGVLVAGQFTQDYFSGRFQGKISKDFNYTQYLVNSYEYYLTNEQSRVDMNYSMWYLNKTLTEIENLQEQSRQNVYDSSAFDIILQPMVQLVKDSTNSNSDYQTYLGFQSDGLFFAYPANKIEYFNSYQDLTCQYDKDRFDPRCRPWYIKAFNNPDHSSAILTEPYSFAQGHQLGQTTCMSNYVFNQFSSAVCLDYSLDIFADRQRIAQNDNFLYSYTLSPDGAVFWHPNFDLMENSQKLPTIQQLEFGYLYNESAKTRQMAAEFTENILPLFYNFKATNSQYQGTISEMMIATQIINLRKQVGGQHEPFAVTGIVISKDFATYRINQLKEKMNDILMAFTILLLVGYLIAVVVLLLLNKWISGSIARPIKRLQKILKQMNKGDLDLDILDKCPRNTSPEMRQLYLIFSKFIKISRLDNPIYFQSYVQSLTNYCQILQIFEEAGNLIGQYICWMGIGYQYYTNKHYIEAQNAYNNAYICYNKISNQNSARDRIEILRMICECHLMSQSNYSVCINFLDEFEDLIKVSNQELMFEFSCIKAEIFANLGYPTDQIFDEIGQYYQCSDTSVPYEMVQDLQSYCKAVQLRHVGKYKDAIRHYIKALTSSPTYYRNTRDRCLQGLNSLLGKYKLPIIQDKQITRKYIVMILEDSLQMRGSWINGSRYFFSQFVQNRSNPQDKFAFVQFGDKAQVQFTLVSADDKSQNIEQQILQRNTKVSENVPMLYKGLKEGVNCLIRYHMVSNSCSIQQQFNVGQRVYLENDQSKSQQRWIVCILSNFFNIDDQQIEKVIVQLKEFDIYLIIIGFDITNDQESKLRRLCDSTRYGLFIKVFNTQDLENLLESILEAMN